MMNKRKNDNSPLSSSANLRLAVVIAVAIGVIGLLILNRSSDVPENRVSFQDDFSTDTVTDWRADNCDWLIQDGAYIQNLVYEGMHCRQIITGFDLKTARITAQVTLIDERYVESDGRWFGVFLRESSTGEYYHLLLDGRDNRVLLTKGREQQILERVFFDVQVNKSYLLRLDAVDNKLIGSINGEPVILAPDIAYNGFSAAGLYMIEARVRFDDVSLSEVP